MQGQWGAWEKIRLVQRLMQDGTSAEGEWILYMEPDVLFDEIAFTFPFDMYAGQGKDLIILGRPEQAQKGDYAGTPLSKVSKPSTGFSKKRSLAARRRPTHT